MTEVHRVDASARAVVQRRAGKVQPAWRATATAGELLDLPDRVILHAGPPFVDPTRPSAVVLSSAVLAMLHAGWASSEEQAESLIRKHLVRLEPAQHWGGVLPLAAVATRETPLLEVVDMAAPTHRPGSAWSLLSSGSGAQIRFGTRAQAVLERMAWRDAVLHPGLQAWFGSHAPLDLWPIACEALAAGDDLHAQTTHATAELGTQLAARGSLSSGVAQMLQQSPLFFLTLWMAACHLMLKVAAESATEAAAADAGANGLVLALAGNGQDFGLRALGKPRRWFTAPASAPQGMRLGDPAIPLSPMVGDSGVIDAAGFGAQAFTLAPQLAAQFAPWRRSADPVAPDIRYGEGHPAMAGQASALAALRFGLDTHAIAGAGRSPEIAIAMLAADGRSGLAGRGIFETPSAAFAAASHAMRQETGPTAVIDDTNPHERQTGWS